MAGILGADGRNGTFDNIFSIAYAACTGGEYMLIFFNVFASLFGVCF